MPNGNDSIIWYIAKSHKVSRISIDRFTVSMCCINSKWAPKNALATIPTPRAVRNIAETKKIRGNLVREMYLSNMTQARIAVTRPAVDLLCKRTVVAITPKQEAIRQIFKRS